MFMIRGQMRPPSQRPQAYQRVEPGGYLAHQLVWEVFRDHEDRKRDFVYAWAEPEGAPPTFYAVAAREPVDDAGGVFELDKRPYAPQLQAGDRLHFRLTANAVVKKRNAQGRQTRHDVVMDRKRELREAGDWPSDELSVEALTREAGLGWLAPRAERAGFRFEPEQVLVSGHRQLDFQKRRNGTRVQLSLLDFEGLLEVVDPEALTAALFEGIGPAKAYGCGLLLVRRAS